ncbi:MAG: hypothetical protein C0606_16685 [Hyphomicrobiales bacterium]|nr:MAG: hypothetical protein C0606_16685 [Hyphomicrobiales bacterium]
MTARLRVSRSKAAGWSRWLGVFAVPVLVLTGLARRVDLIDPLAAIGAIAVGSGLGLSALVLSIVAFAGIWRDGRRGLGDAVRGFIPGLIAVAPLAFATAMVVFHPQMADISTDVDEPPVYPVDLRGTHFAANSMAPPPRAERERQRTAYPDIVSRRFPLSPILMFETVRLTIREEGWPVIAERAPRPERMVGEFQVTARTLLFSFPDDIVIRVLPDPYGARVDIRSSSRYGRHDLGANAERIRTIFAAIDEMLVETFGQSAPEELDTTAPGDDG